MGARLKVFLIFAVLWVVFIGIAYGLFYLLIYLGYLPPGSSYYTILMIMIPVLLLFNLVTYFYSDKMVLSAYNARIVTEREAPKLARTVQKIATQSGLPMPRLAIVPSQTPNAFATGRDPEHAVVAVTEGTLGLLSDDELEGVIGHEMAHVLDRDILVMTVVSSAAAIISIVARIAIYQAMFGGRRQNVNPLVLLAAAITAPLAAMLIQLAVSRSREYKADRQSAMITMKPLALARALSKLQTVNERRPMQFGSQSPAHASLFIVNPFSKGAFVSLFSTHPPIESRIKRLEKLADKEGYLQ